MINPPKVSEIEGCETCPMRELFPRNTFVAPDVPITATRLQVGEAPGEDESIIGKPFIGGAGRVRDSLLRAAGIDKETIATCNIIQCRPPKNVFPTASQAKFYIDREKGEEAVQHCLRHHVQPLLSSKPWQRVDLLGDTPLRYLAGRDEGILKCRGSIMKLAPPNEGLRAIPTIHPAYIMRNQKMLPVVVNDLKKSLQIPPENYNLTPSVEEFEAWCEGTEEFAFDIETKGWTNEISIVGLSKDLYSSIIVPFHGRYRAILAILFGRGREVVGHNIIQFDLPILDMSGCSVPKQAVIWDTMLMHHLLFPDLSGNKDDENIQGAAGGGHSLEFCATQMTNKPIWKEEGRNQEGYWTLRCARDVDVTWQIYKQLRPMLGKEKLEDIYHLVQVPLAKICHLMHETGVKQDPSRLTEVRAKLSAEIQELERALPERLRTHKTLTRKRIVAPPGSRSEKTGRPIRYLMTEVEEEEVPWRSDNEIYKFLYEEMALPVQKHVKTGQPTTDKTALDKLRRGLRRGKFFPNCNDPRLLEGFDPAGTIDSLLKLRKASSLITTFAKENTSGGATRIHTNFNVHGTSSGRLSSSDPNLQNIPESTRFLYVPDHVGWKWIKVDYSGIENRITAWYANDTDRLQRFALDPKFSEHKWVCSRLFGIPYCLAPETLVLKSDASWCPVAFLKKGDELLAFDETIGSYGPKFKKATVEGKRTVYSISYRIKTNKGTITVSADHRFIDRSLRRRTSESKKYSIKEPERWIKAENLRIGDRIAFFGKPWKEDCTNFGGWFAGFLDGEGCISKTNVLSFAQNPGLVANKALKYLELNNFQYGKKGIHYWINGGIAEKLRLLGTTRPVRLLKAIENAWKGTRIWSKTTEPAIIEEITCLGYQEVIGIQTTSKTLISEGFFSHNSEVEKDNDKDAPYGKAKRANHGFSYGMGPLLLSKLYDMEFKECKILLKGIAEAYEKTVKWQEAIGREATSKGVLTTVFGRKRWFYTNKSFTEGLSFKPQSTAADIIFRAMLGLMYERIEWPEERVLAVLSRIAPLPKPANLLLQVHDELDFESPSELVDEVVEKIRYVMEQPWPELGGFSIPVEIEVGDSWGETEGI